MKKKLFLGALVLGALTLNSCVDNVESDSVKAVRQAKVEQLKAKAEFDKAQAEAELINANVAKAAQEAAAKLAEAQAAEAQANAEYQKAQADYWKAMAAYQDALTEAEKAKAAQAAELAAVNLEQQKVALETAKATLEAYKKQMEADVAKWEKQLYENLLNAFNNKKKYEDALKNADKAEIAALMTEYNNAASNLLEAQKTLAENKLTLAKLEAGFDNPAESVVDDINMLNLQINRYQEENDKLQAQIDAWRTNDYTTAEAALEKAQKELAELKNTLEEKKNAFKAAELAAKNAKYALKSSDYITAINKVKAISAIFYRVTNNNVTTTYNLAIQYATNSTAPGVKGNWCAVITTSQGGYILDTDYVPLFTDVKVESTPINYQKPDDSAVYTVTYHTYTKYYNLIDDKCMDKLAETYQEFVDNSHGKTYKARQKEYDDQNVKVYGKDGKGGYQATYDALASLAKTWKEADAAATAAGDDVTAEQTQAVADAKKKFFDEVEAQKLDKTYPDTMTPTDVVADYEENTLNIAKKELNEYKSSMNRALNRLNAFNEIVKDIEGYATTLNNGNEANTVAMNAVNEANVVEAKAELAKVEAENAYEIKDAEITALKLITDATDSVDGETVIISTMIDRYTQQIEKNNKRIEKLKIDLEVFEKQLASGNISVETAIENAKTQIAYQETIVAQWENKVKEAKEALEAALGDTPAE